MYDKVIQRWCGVYGSLHDRSARKDLVRAVYDEMKGEGLCFIKRDESDALERVCHLRISRHLAKKSYESRSQDPDQKSLRGAG